MRGTRWLILVAILAILGAVGIAFRVQNRLLEHESPQKPPPLPVDLNSTARDWHWSRTDNGRTVVEIWAKKYDQSQDNSLVVLHDVKLHLMNKTADHYDLVQTAVAQFRPADKRLRSDGEVQITLEVPVDGPAPANLVSIRTSKVTFDSTTGKAETDQPTWFTFQNGDGQSVGAAYDPTSRELHLKSRVVVHWKPRGPHAKPMLIESGELLYREAHSDIWLLPWARLTRDNTVVEGGPSIVNLQNGVLQHVSSQMAHGTDHYPNRNLQYSADNLWVDFDPSGEIQRIAGEPNARLVNSSAAAETTITARRVDMNFNSEGGESVLQRVIASGQSVVTSKPAGEALKNPQTVPDTRILRSQVVYVAMGPDGKQMDEMHTETPGSLELIPHRAAQHHRRLEGSQLWMKYGPQNQLESFRAVKVTTFTDPTPEEQKRKVAQIVTHSQNLNAKFEPKTGQLSRMEQWDDFTYQQGERQARAARGIMESGGDQVTLERSARVWDPSGATSADVIHMNERSGDFTADGHVNSSHLPDQQPSKKGQSGMLSSDQPLQAIANKMTSTHRNRLVHYEGGVVLWQGANRIVAQQADIDRDTRKLVAAGNVVSTFLDQSGDKAGAGGRGPGAGDKSPTVRVANTAPNPKSQIPNPIFTVVRAQHLVYTDNDRLACYTGNAVLMRPGLEVKAREIRAWLAESGSDSRLERAFADGAVHIVEVSPDRSRTGTGEHSEYYTADQKVILRSGGGHEARVVESFPGNKPGDDTRGDELTYFANDDRLLVNGTSGRPAVSHIRKKKS